MQIVKGVSDSLSLILLETKTSINYALPFVVRTSYYLFVSKVRDENLSSSLPLPSGFRLFLRRNLRLRLRLNPGLICSSACSMCLAAPWLRTLGKWLHLVAQMALARTNVGKGNYGQICSRFFPLRAEATGVAGVISTLRKKQKIDLLIIAIPHARLFFATLLDSLQK